VWHSKCIILNEGYVYIYCWGWGGGVGGGGRSEGVREE
jgi:hypothetical protein